MLKKDILYRVVEDLQGGEFGMYRDLTVEQWRQQAIEWATIDDNYNVVELLQIIRSEKVIDFISDLWQLEFKKVQDCKYDKQTLLEMALEKKKALQHLEGISGPLCEHLIKLVVYGRSLGNEIFDGWIDKEVCNYISYINSVKVKTTSGKLSEAEYRRLLLADLGETQEDYFNEIRFFRIKFIQDNKYPDFKPVVQMSRTLFSIGTDLLNVVCPIISKPNCLTQKDFEPIVRNILSKNGVN